MASIDGLPARQIVVLDRYGVAYFDGHSDFRHPGNALALVTGRGPDLDPDARLATELTNTLVAALNS
ncbi:MAG: hypothetical protein QOC67_3554 [Pseudonocardiales bacterium]|nr:hypothetical protein [Pseudonocardiales bacterium]MDT7684010.1 hypothetical protein [Pseudonocardiales bacterium]MDT7774630.1 hypothetical protein [Pseudonocardiales bacterium]